LLYLAAQRRRGRDATRFTNRDLLPNLAPRAPGWRRHVPVAFYLLALSALLIALAGPRAVVPVRQEQATVVMVLDTSISMRAVDVQPTRLAALQAAGRRFLEILPAPVRVGMVAFSAAPQVLAPPTPDRAALLAALRGLRAEGGTAMGDAIERAVDVAQLGAQPEGSTPGSAEAAGAGGRGTTPPAAIVLLSDGANTAGQEQPLDAATRARDLGIPIHTIAFGTSSGTIESPDAPGSGQRMAVPPDEATLRQVAQLTGGRFFTAPTAADLMSVYEQLGARVGVVEEEREITVAFAAAGAILLAAGGAIALLWFNRFP
jgi:Ca-activated chloride channel family protein